MLMGDLGSCSMRSDAGSGMGSGVAERVVVFDTAVDGVRVLAAGEPEIGVVELGDGHDMHESGHEPLVVSQTWGSKATLTGTRAWTRCRECLDMMRRGHLRPYAPERALTYCRRSSRPKCP